MANGPGIARFEPLYLLQYAYIDGAWVQYQENVPAADAPSLVVTPTHGGTHDLFRPFRGALAPKDYNAKTWQLKVTARGQDEWEALKATKAKAAPFYFSLGARQTDTFALTAGQVGKLSRPLAIGIIAGVAAPDYATVVKKNGSVSVSAATVAGQNVTCVETGTITVEYTPAHVVVITSWTENIIGHNHSEVDLTIEETLV